MHTTLTRPGKTARIIIMQLLPSFSHAHTFSRSDNSDIYCSNEVHSQCTGVRWRRKKTEPPQPIYSPHPKNYKHFILGRLGITLESAPAAIFCLLLKLKDSYTFRGIPGFYSTSGLHGSDRFRRPSCRHEMRGFYCY